MWRKNVRGILFQHTKSVFTYQDNMMSFSVNNIRGKKSKGKTKSVGEIIKVRRMRAKEGELTYQEENSALEILPPCAWNSNRDA